MNMVLTKLRERLGGYSRLVMFSHTVFSLPFGLISMLWAYGGVPPLKLFILILAALVFARNGANAFNRVADRKIDARNERTALRPLQTGEVRLREAWIITILCFAGLAVCAWFLNPLCLILLPLALFVFVFYSYTKRFTWLCHFVLGLACGGAPVGAWAAAAGSLSLVPFALGGAMTFWVAGFDIIYATQDIDFDRREGLFSVPARFGLKNGLRIAAASHAAAVACLIAASALRPQGILYFAGILAVSALLVFEHLSVRPSSRRRMSFVAYSMNQIVSVTFFVFAALDFFVIGEKMVWITLPWA